MIMINLHVLKYLFETTYENGLFHILITYLKMYIFLFLTIYIFSI